MILEDVKAIKDILSTTESGISLTKQIDALMGVFRPFKPEVKRFRINYLDKTSELKYLINMPSGLKRKTHRKVELPATTGFWIDEVLDLETTDMLSIDFDSTGKKHVFDANKFPQSEKFLITLKGKVTNSFLENLVSVDCAKNPTRKEGRDCYWIHSTLKDVSVFEKIWDELDIEEVKTDIRIGVERYFGSTIPNEIKRKFEAQRALLSAIEHGDRNIEGLKSRYRHSARKTHVSPSDLVDLMMKLVSGDYFSQFIGLDDKFKLGSIEPKREITSLIPERVLINVHSDLNYKSPFAKGNLTFERKRYVDKIAETINEFVPSKK